MSTDKTLLCLLVLFLPAELWAQDGTGQPEALPSAEDVPAPPAQGQAAPEPDEEPPAEPDAEAPQEMEPPAEPDAEAPQEMEPPAEPDAEAPTPDRWQAVRLDVAHAEGVPGLAPGDRIDAPRQINLDASSCLRIGGTGAALLLAGPAELRAEPGPSGLTVVVVRGRGVLWGDGQGALVRAGDHSLAAQSGAVLFDTSRSGAEGAAALAGQVWIDGEPAAATDSSAQSELLEPRFCAPPRPQITVTLGDPASLVEQTQTRRAQQASGEDEPASAEAGATCVDSAALASASDPGQGTDPGVDPDSRRDVGQVRVRVTLPERSP